MVQIIANPFYFPIIELLAGFSFFAIFPRFVSVPLSMLPVFFLTIFFAPLQFHLACALWGDDSPSAGLKTREIFTL